MKEMKKENSEYDRKIIDRKMGKRAEKQRKNTEYDRIMVDRIIKKLG